VLADRVEGQLAQDPVIAVAMKDHIVQGPVRVVVMENQLARDPVMVAVMERAPGWSDSARKSPELPNCS
jgi:hypothetical protein